jgi:hypothetical protein
MSEAIDHKALEARHGKGWSAEELEQFRLSWSYSSDAYLCARLMALTLACSCLVGMFLSLLRPAFFVRPDLEDTAQLPPGHVAANELGDLVPGNRWQSVGYARSGRRATEVTLQHFVILHLRPPGLPRQVPPGPGALGTPCGKKGLRDLFIQFWARRNTSLFVPIKGIFLSLTLTVTYGEVYKSSQ